MTKQNWQQIYLAGEQLNRYPYDFIVSGYFRHRPVPRPRVLDLGCGAGNHALFCAENGAEVLALDYADAALEVVSQRAQERSLQQHVRTARADFEDFHLPESGFDMAIDRLAVSHVAMGDAERVYQHVHDAMNPGGVVLACLFSDAHSHKDYGTHDPQRQIWHSFSDGIFAPLKTACFYSEDEIRHLFRHFELLALNRCSEQDLLQPGEQQQSWHIIARKKP